MDLESIVQQSCYDSVAQAVCWSRDTVVFNPKLWRNCEPSMNHTIAEQIPITTTRFSYSDAQK